MLQTSYQITKVLVDTTYHTLDLPWYMEEFNVLSEVLCEGAKRPSGGGCSRGYPPPTVGTLSWWNRTPSLVFQAIYENNVSSPLFKVLTCSAHFLIHVVSILLVILLYLQYNAFAFYIYCVPNGCVIKRPTHWQATDKKTNIVKICVSVSEQSERAWTFFRIHKNQNSSSFNVLSWNLRIIWHVSVTFVHSIQFSYYYSWHGTI